MNITVIGCGNAGLIHAAKMIEKGYKVGLLKTSNITNEDFFSLIKSEGGYNVKDETNGGNRFWVKPEFITKDVELAVGFADIIFVTTTTLQHEWVAKLIAPYVKDGQLIVVVPGYMGSLIFKRYIKKDVVYSEWETTAYNGRIMDSLYVRITFYNPRNAISVLPIKEKDKVVSVLSKLFDNTRYLRKNILESAFHNPNMIVHTIGMLFSASRIEYSKGEFWMYREAFTKSVINVIQAFDIQKNRILNRFDCDSLDYFEAAKWRNEEDLSLEAMTVFESFAESSNKGPSMLKHRYLLEDVPMGLCLFSSIGKVIGEDTSIADSIITLAGSLLERNFRKECRTIQYLMGNDDIEEKHIVSVIEEGKF
ncbi:MAG TPA: NAD/NADP octopine/nopaline dehydrogenase [Porphyromonadaceae bacterium]|jgi:opine dehydrogenase|nr:NAD/NADP octopine/nopaline dehydrogenase [Porphyromonadaceae bacterium]